MNNLLSERLRRMNLVAGEGREVAFDDLRKMKCPQSAKSHPSLPHVEVFDRFKHIFELREDIKIVRPRFLVSPKKAPLPNARFMARFEIQKVEPNGSGITDHYGASPDYTFQGAITNSYDQTLETCCHFGTQVFVCTNGMWWISTKKNSSRMLSKHTMQEFSTMVWNLSCELDSIYAEVVGGFEALKKHDFSSRKEVYDFVLQSTQRGVIQRLEALRVLRHWNEPEHAEFQDRNGYSLFNAYTSHWRDSDQFLLPDRTMRLKKFMAEYKQDIRVDTVSASSRLVL